MVFNWVIACGVTVARLSSVMFHSVYNEERNLLRRRAWEQRNQETSQDKELNSENVPLFGEPYKVNVHIIAVK